MMYLTLTIFFGFLVLEMELRRSPNELNVSLEPPNPLMFWQMTTFKHDTVLTSNHRYATLHGVTPPTVSATTTNEILDFKLPGFKYFTLGASAEYAHNIDAICLTFNIYFTDILQNAVLAQFIGIDDSVNVELRLEGVNMVADWVDSNGASYTGTIGLKTGKWIGVGFQFNTLWGKDDQVDLFQISGSKASASSFMGIDPVTLPALKSIVIGGDINGVQASFLGEIGCVQIYNTSILGGTRGDSQDLCDQNLVDPDFGDFTFGGVLPFTTDATSEATTTEQTTLGTTTLVTTTVEQTTLKTTDIMTTSPPQSMHTGYDPVYENCEYFRLHQQDRSLAAPTLTITVNSASSCFSMCKVEAGCMAVSMAASGVGPMECRVSDQTTTVAMPGFVVYSV